MKSMIESLVASYKCPECGEGANDENVDIIGAAGNTINIDLVCEKCGKHSMIKSEVINLDLQNGAVSPEQIEILRHHLQDKWVHGEIKSSQTAVSDKEITQLHKKLQESDINLSELFTDTDAPENREEK